MKRIKSLLTAAVMTLSLCVSTLPQYAGMPVSAETEDGSEETASCTSFDAETGTLTLYGSVVRDEVTQYKNKENVKSLVCEEGTVFPSFSAGMFWGFSYLETADLTNADFSAVVQADLLFTGCRNLKSVNLAGLDTGNVTSMVGMFQNCKALTAVDLSSVDTTGLLQMSFMFCFCESLTELDLSSFDTSSLERADNMFDHCSSLKTIYVSPAWNMESIQSAKDMFDGCEQLIGGNGTVYSAEHTDEEYARIDTDGAPGYLTLHPDYAEPNTVRIMKVDINGDPVKGAGLVLGSRGTRRGLPSSRRTTWLAA